MIKNPDFREPSGWVNREPADEEHLLQMQFYLDPSPGAPK
jgi:hypothetical protein